MSATSKTPEDLINLAAAARLADVAYNTVRSWISKGLIRGWDRLGKIYVSKAEVLKAIEPVEIETETPVRTRAQDLRAANAAIERMRANGVKIR